MCRYKSLIEDAYEASGLEQIFIDKKEEGLNCFIKVSNDVYPPRYEFEIYEHNLKKDNIFILKFGEKGRAVMAISADELRIIDIFLAENWQNKKILSGLIIEMKKKVAKDFKDIKYITLASIGSGVVAWHKIGFEFYTKKHEKLVRTILSKKLRRVGEIKSFTKEELESNDCYKELEFLGNIPMYMEIRL